MKKILLSATIALSVLSTNAKTKTQNITNNPHAIGFRVGLTTPTYLGGNDGEYTRGMNTGFVGGLIYSYYFSDILSIQPELLFMQGGWALSKETEISGIKIKESQNVSYGYVQIPVLIKARFGSDAIKFTVHAGPYIGIATGGSAHYKAEQTTAPTSTFETNTPLKVEKNSLAPLDLGAAVGIGTNILLGPGVIIIDLRANIGLTDVFQLDPVPSDWKPYNNFIPSISVGYLFQLGSN